MVYQICHWLNDQGRSPSAIKTTPPQQTPLGLPLPHAPAELIPANILTKPPSAELKPGQVDQDSLPSYAVLDDILRRLIQAQESPATIIAAGHDAAVVDKIVRLWQRAEFKRRQAPPVLKVTDRAFGTGWRMPIASRWTM